MTASAAVGITASAARGNRMPQIEYFGDLACPTTRSVRIRDSISMKTIHLIAVVLAAASWSALKAKEQPRPNPMIDYPGFLANASAVGKLRRERPITEAEFVRMAAEPGTIIFDARSDSKFNLLHIKGARHLPLPDVTAAELANVIPDKSSRILIYCNNNFENEPRALPGKWPPPR